MAATNPAGLISKEAINSLYQKNFGRDADAAGLDYWAKDAAARGVTDLSALEGDIRRGAQGYDVVALGDRPTYSSSWSPSLNPNATTNIYDANQDRWVTEPGVQQTKRVEAPVPQGALLHPPAEAKPREIGTNETVEGRLSGLLTKGSPLMKSAETYALENMNKRGLLNSSLAVNAAQRAIVDTAAPIAAQDASTFAAAGLSAQNANQDITKTGYQGIIQSKLQAEQAQQNQALAQINNQARMDLEAYSKQWDANIESMRLASDDKKAFSSMYGPVMQQYQSEFAKIQTDPNASAEAKSTLINQLRAETDSKLKTMADLFGYKMEWTVPVAATPAPQDAPPGGDNYRGYAAVGDGLYRYGDGRALTREQIDAEEAVARGLGAS